MNELREALSLVHDLLNAGGKDFAGWRLYRLERLLHTMQERYFLTEDDRAVLTAEGWDDELVEITADPRFPAA